MGQGEEMEENRCKEVAGIERKGFDKGKRVRNAKKKVELDRNTEIKKKSRVWDKGKK